jgi:DNA-binding transcriptional ArsR family regulator
MAQSAFPMTPTAVDTEQEPRVVSFDDAHDMIEAMSSETARSILGALDDESLTPATLADRVDTSLQNVIYHLDRLREADLVAVVGTRYSARGNEMDVYAPASDPVVICVGDDRSEDAVTRLVDESASSAERRDPSITDSTASR